jgi:RNA polymerase sigma factor (sigma-70 family)
MYRLDKAGPKRLQENISLPFCHFFEDCQSNRLQMMHQIMLPGEELSDAELVKRLLAGEKKLFELIIRRYNQRFFRIGMSILNNDAEAEDAMQATYIKTYEHLSQFGNRSSFSTWMTKIMLNECLVRKNRNRRFKMESAQQLENHTSMKTPAYTLMNKELSVVLENAVAQLPEKYRLVFVLREIEEMSVKETSEALSIEEPNVKVRLNRAKTMLRSGLNGYMKDHVYSFHLSRCDRIVANVLGHLGV